MRDRPTSRGRQGRSTAIAWIAVTIGFITIGATSAHSQEARRHYSLRMEAMFVRMDSNGDGRLVPAEVKGQPYLERRLQRPDSRGYLLLEDLHTRSPHHNGPRLQHHFQRADRNHDGHLSRQEAQALPWVARHFTSLDLNADGRITLTELWSLQKALAPRMRP